MNANQTNAELPCPCCRRMTRSLKCYRIVDFMLFFVLGAMVRRRTPVACPSCMRKIIGRRTLVNILPAHVAWIVGILPWHLFQFLRSFVPGHSMVIRERLAATSGAEA